MFENKIAKSIVSVYFVALAILMYYFIDVDIFLPIGISCKHIFALCIIVSTFIVFLVNPRVSEAVVSLKSALVFSLPLLAVYVVSMFVWILEKTDTATIRRGISLWIIHDNWFSFALCAMALLYLFGENGIWLNLLAIVLSNLFMIFQIIAEYGIGVFMKELFELIVTFSETTGDVIVEAEIHELAFCLGVYLIYMIYKPKREVWFWVLFGLAAFCFVCAMKRIAMFAVLSALAVRVLLWAIGKFSSKAVIVSVTWIMIVSVVILIVYIFSIRSGLFTYFDSHGVSTNGRSEAYEWANQFYTFSPWYYGRGTGFVAYQLGQDTLIGLNTIHNDFLQFYIDLGFFGFIFWLLSMTVVRTSYFSKNGDSDSAVVACILTVYFLVCCATDNTIDYPLLITVMAIIMAGNNYSGRVEKQRERFAKRIKGVL